MPPKKQQRNGYFFFMSEWKKGQEDRGQTFPGGFRDVQSNAVCSREWQNLSNEQKQYYNDMAQKGKGQTVKLTGWGEPIAHVQAREREAAEFKEQMRVSIQNTVEVAKKGENIPDLQFFFIHVNYFYSRDRSDASTDYAPAEMAICEFSLAEGVTRFYHQIINIEVPIGFARETREHADETHKLPIDCEQGESDYLKIYEKFRKFLQPINDDKAKLPVIYTCEKFTTVVSCFLDRMIDAAGVPQDTFVLYTLECLFGKLISICNPDLHVRCNPVILAKVELEKDLFSYSPNIECEFHSKLEGASIHCSLAIIRQWCYAICDYCCNWFSIKMIHDVHCPAISHTSDVDSLVTSAASLSIEKVLQVSTLKSMTGVTEEYRMKKAERTAKDEQKRRRDALLNPLEIIDHGLIKPETASPAVAPPAAPAETVQKYLRPLRAPKSLSMAVKGSDSVPELNDSNFPSIGAPGRGQPAANRIEKQSRPALRGRGRGGLPYY